MTRFLAGLILGLFFATSVFAQSGASVKQSGSSVSPNTVPYWVTNGAIGDSVTSADSPVTSFGVTSAGQLGICDNSARSSSSGWIGLCMGYVSGVPTISVQNYGTATAQPLQFVVNGTTYAFPGSLTNISIGTTPVIGGTNSECLYVAAGVVGQQACTLSAITSLTGDATATGPGVAALTLATVNANTGSWGSGTQIPTITVNAKGLITAASQTPLSLTVGTTTITSGSTNSIFYDNGGLLGNLATTGNAVLSTSAGGVPSMATTLPTGLTVPSPTFTGTETFPDAATWTSTGITKAAAISVGSALLPAGGNVSISGQYQVNGTQIAASNLSNGTTGSGAVVLATSPTLAGTVAGSVTLSGNLTLSGNDSFTGQSIFQGTSAPASAAGNTVVMGTMLAPTLTNTGQGFIYNTTANGMVLAGDGSTYDVTLSNKSGGVAIGVGTGTTVPVMPGLAAGTCSSGMGLDAANNVIKVSCPGAASSIQVGTTSVASATQNTLLGPGTVSAGTGTLASVAAGYGVTISASSLAMSLTELNSALGANVLLNNTANFFDGPSVAQGSSGLFLVEAFASLTDSAGAASFTCKIYDGTTAFAATSTYLSTSSVVANVNISTIVNAASTAGNLRIACRDISSTSGSMLAAVTGVTGNIATQISAIRVQ